MKENSKPGHIYSGGDSIIGYLTIKYQPPDKVIIRKNGKVLRVLEPVSGSAATARTFVLDFYTNEDDMLKYGFLGDENGKITEVDDSRYEKAIAARDKPSASRAMTAAQQGLIDRMQVGRIVFVDDMEKITPAAPEAYPETLGPSRLTAWFDEIPASKNVARMSLDIKTLNELYSRANIHMTNDSKTSQWIIYGGLLNRCIVNTIAEIMNGGFYEDRKLRDQPILPGGSVNHIVIPLFAINHTFQKVDGSPTRRYEGKDGLPELLAEHSQSGHIYSGLEGVEYAYQKNDYVSFNYRKFDRVILRKNGEVLKILEPSLKGFTTSRTFILDFYTKEDDKEDDEDMLKYGFLGDENGKISPAMIGSLYAKRVSRLETHLASLYQNVPVEVD